MVLRAGAAQLVAQNRAVMQRPDLRPHLPSLACPLLLITGETDGVTPPEHAREIAAAVPGAQLHLIDDAGHLPTLEAPQRVSQLMLQWLEALR
jgi:pimeloyl-ACP methyl ester carboxylesterase